MKKIAISLIALGAIVLLFSIGAAAAQQADPLEPAGGSGALAFTYQGQLKASGVPVNNICDFQFSVWNADNGGVQFGTTQLVPDVQVVNSLFTVTMNESGQFGTQTFTGAVRYLQTEVRCPAGSGQFVVLLPRQQITAAPVALSLAPGAVISTTTGTQAFKILNSYNAGQVLLLQNGSPNANGSGGGDFLKGVNYPGTSTMFKVDTNGDFSQAVTAGGLVKAAALVRCGTAPLINRYFNNLSGSTPTVAPNGTGACIVNFGADLFQRFFVATPTETVSPRMVSVQANAAGNINIYLFNSAGTPVNGDVMLLVY